MDNRLGDKIQIVTQYGNPEKLIRGKKEGSPAKRSEKTPQFNLKPEELIAYLDQFIIKQDRAKAVLSTKICTHFNRLEKEKQEEKKPDATIGRIKSNILLIGPTGVGKTYIVKLIAHKLGVPFVKGDATKFSETGYVGGDVDDLVRDLVREADDDISLAEHGIIYIDEIDKIASSKGFTGADISRTGVQRALLKPMEETEIELQPPHDPLSMMEALAEFQKTGSRERKTINTKNILFIVSGAFSGMDDIIAKRLKNDTIGFNAPAKKKSDENKILHMLKSQDLVDFGFESEFVGRLPVRAVLDSLEENDLLEILENPNNPTILGKKADFGAYDININFDTSALKLIAKNAAIEKTGARGLVNSVENLLLPFETKLPSANINIFSFTEKILKNPDDYLDDISKGVQQADKLFLPLKEAEEEKICAYIKKNLDNLESSTGFMFSEAMIKTAAHHYSRKVETVQEALLEIKKAYYEIRSIEDEAVENKDINVELDQESAEYLIHEFLFNHQNYLDIKKSFIENFSLGLMLAREKTDKNKFIVTKKGLTDPENYISELLRG